MNIFGDVYFLIKQLHISIASDQDIWDWIVILIALDLLHDN